MCDVVWGHQFDRMQDRRCISVAWNSFTSAILLQTDSTGSTYNIGKQNVLCTLIIRSAIFFFNIMIGTCHGDVFPDAQNYTGSKESLPKHTACFNTKTWKHFYWEGKIFISCSSLHMLSTTLKERVELVHKTLIIMCCEAWVEEINWTIPTKDLKRLFFYKITHYPWTLASHSLTPQTTAAENWVF